MDTKETMDFITKTLNELPDATGILRCVLFADITRAFISLRDQIKQNEEKQKEDKLKLEARIADLEEENSVLKNEQTERK